jgi:hypothetical protein
MTSGLLHQISLYSMLLFYLESHSLSRKKQISAFSTFFQLHPAFAHTFSTILSLLVAYGMLLPVSSYRGFWLVQRLMPHYFHALGLVT